MEHSKIFTLYEGHLPVKSLSIFRAILEVMMTLDFWTFTEETNENDICLIKAIFPLINSESQYL